MTNAEKQRRKAPVPMACADSMRGGAEMPEFLMNEAHWIPDKPKPTFWQRARGLFQCPNDQAKGRE